jgi:alcohol oxidase
MADPIDFDVGWLKDPQEVDVKKHVWAYKLAREMFRRMPIFRGELKGNHPNFAENSKAAVVERADGPIAKGDERVEYSEEDEKALEQKIRETLSTTWHSLGTCKMAPKDQKGVVDASLNVHGLQNLKLADLSVPPEVSVF